MDILHKFEQATSFQRATAHGAIHGPGPLRRGRIGPALLLLSVIFGHLASVNGGLYAEEPGPNELQISFGLGPAGYESQYEERTRTELLAAGFLIGGLGNGSEWVYSGSSARYLRIGYLRNEWLFEMVRQTYTSDVNYQTFISGNLGTFSATGFTTLTGELYLNQTGLIAGYDLLERKNPQWSVYLLAGFRGITEEHLVARTNITTITSGSITATAPGVAPEDEFLASGGTLYTGFDLRYRYSDPITLKLRMGLEAGGGEWDTTELLVSPGDYNFRREIGDILIAGLQLDLGLEYHLSPDWSLFARLQTHRLWIKTEQVIPITASGSGITNDQRVLDFLLTYNGAEHKGTSTALVAGFTYRYHFW